MPKYTDSIFGAFNFVSETGGKEDYREILPQIVLSVIFLPSLYVEHSGLLLAIATHIIIFI